MSTNSDIVHVIQSSYHHEDNDGRRVVTSSIMEDEGWFATSESAQNRCDQLNARNTRGWENANQMAERQHQKRVDEAELRNRKAAAIRAAGMEEKDVPVPGPFAPLTLEEYLASSNHAFYEVLAVSRSEHDSLTAAGS